MTNSPSVCLFHLLLTAGQAAVVALLAFNQPRELFFGQISDADAALLLSFRNLLVVLGDLKDGEWLWENDFDVC